MSVHDMATYKPIVEEKSTSDKLAALKGFICSCYNSILIAMIFTLLGIGVGIYVCHKYYNTRMDEVVQTGAMLHGKKVYTITPKL
ncbi:hypothetical protein [Geobacter sp. SVR]|uniref:hypothetical protein n=1 Tax=Geobacter sp. SVR TaxID=2495594 RepID=UPI00143EF829|nr:hypothetical protein [Geobacter sp. SVR]BCS54105.1 hypothetical protein GSVR_24130 [Geobacter sp. SVR]GCF87588.1 hypothetical protein GSbR_41880 [Geobacter sp. SVR]